MAGQTLSAEQYRYLALGFFAQQLITGFVSFLEEQNRAELGRTLREVIDSLEGAIEVDPHAGTRTFRTYQEMRTLHDLVRSEKVDSPEEIIKTLKEIESNLQDEPVENLREKLGKAIRWFASLQDQALRNYSSSSEPIPSGIGRLCRTTG